MKITLITVIARTNATLNHNAGFHFVYFFFTFLILTMLQLGIYSRQPKFWRYLLCYKRNTELTIFCFLNKVQVMILFTL